MDLPDTLDKVDRVGPAETEGMADTEETVDIAP